MRAGHLSTGSGHACAKPLTSVVRRLTVTAQGEHLEGTVNGMGFGRRKLLLTATALVAAGPVARAGAAPARIARSRSTGGFEIRPLVDASGPFFRSRQAAFPDATGDDWERARR